MTHPTRRTAIHPQPGYRPMTSTGDLQALEAAVAWLAPLGLTQWESVLALPGERRGPIKSLCRLPAPDGTTVFVKRYDFDRAQVFWRSALKLNFPVYSGPRELRNLLELSGAGLRVPLPLACGERDAGTRRQSFVALAQLAGRPLSELPPPPTREARRRLASEVAALVRRLHGAGFWHRDLYLCNLFSDPERGLGLLDCERVDRAPAGPPWRWRVKDLAALAYSSEGATAGDRAQFLRCYLGRPRLTRGDRRLTRAVSRKAARIARHGAKASGA